jgi:mono/diheme cytochrome c family protein
MPELAMDAPSFEEIGSRRNDDWMARWIADPKNLRATAHMPKMFAGESAQKNSEAVAAFLASLKSGAANSAEKEAATGQSDAGQQLFEKLHCAACHNAPDSPEVAANKILLGNVGEKFSPGALVDFLKQPDQHYAWIRMPRFNLSDEQRQEIAAYLLANSERPAVAEPANGETVELGKKMVQTSGCLNCHALKLDNQFSTKALASVPVRAITLLLPQCIASTGTPYPSAGSGLKRRAKIPA